jgi:hypothetical protein
VEAASCSETLVLIYQTTQRYTPENYNLEVEIVIIGIKLPASHFTLIFTCGDVAIGTRFKARTRDFSPVG